MLHFYICGRIIKFLEFSRTEINVFPVKEKGAELTGLDCAVCEASWKRLRYVSMMQLAMKCKCFKKLVVCD
jgi:hypothetical protein